MRKIQKASSICKYPIGKPNADFFTIVERDVRINAIRLIFLNRVGDVQVRLEAINRVYEFMILGVLKLGCISRYTPWTNAIPMYNVKLVDVFSGLLYSRPIKIQYFSRDY